MRSGQATYTILVAMKQQLRFLTIDEIENLLHDLQKSNIILQPDVETFFKDLRENAYCKCRKKCKKPALMIHQSLVRDEENGNKLKNVKTISALRMHHFREVLKYL